jgi:hypothetical protein
MRGERTGWDIIGLFSHIHGFISQPMVWDLLRICRLVCNSDIMQIMWLNMFSFNRFLRAGNALLNGAVVVSEIGGLLP